MRGALADPCFTAARVPGRETVFVAGDSVRAPQLCEGELRRVQRDCFVRAASTLRRRRNATLGEASDRVVLLLYSASVAVSVAARCHRVDERKRTCEVNALLML
jgi:hypothetical protein